MSTIAAKPYAYTFDAARLALVSGAPALAAAGMAAGRRLRPSAAALALGGLAGLAFALFSVACRVLPASPLAKKGTRRFCICAKGTACLVNCSRINR